MNRAIRRVGFVVVLLFVAVAAQLTYLQLVRAHTLDTDPRNVRVVTRDLTRDRGAIVTSDGAVVAKSVPSNDSLKFKRVYPLRDLFGHITGYQALNIGNTGVEREYDDELLGRDVRLQTQSLSDLLNTHNPTGTVVLTLTRTAQQAAKDALGPRRGSVVVLDVQTGGIVAMFSQPAFDPTPLTSHRAPRVQEYFDYLEALPNHPDLPRAYRERYPPGSTFKVLTAAVALETPVAQGGVTPETPFPRVTNIPLPLSNRTLSNFGGEVCGGTVAESFTHSCNTTFAQIGLNLGDRLAQGLTAFGINGAAPPIDLSPGAATSVGPEVGTFQRNQPFFALDAIGQKDVAVTPLEMALVAESVANNGVMMVPHVMSAIRASDGTVVRRYAPKVWHRVMQPTTASILNGFMRSVVTSGTGTAAQIPGITVAGKTGTAEAPPGHPHAWFIAFAPAEAPRYAIAVIVEHGGDARSETTGGRVAAPVARQVLTTLLQGPASG